MTSYRLAALVAISSLLLTLSADPAEKTLDNKVRHAIAMRYPGEQIVASCGGAFLGKPHDAAIALHHPTQKQFRVVWVGADGTVRELQSMAAFGKESEFELQCLNAPQAEKLKQTLRQSEAVRDFLRLLAGKGMLCYFVEQTQTQCWSITSKGNWIDAGGWQT